MGSWALAEVKWEHNCILSRWSQLLCDYSSGSFSVFQQRVLVLIDEGFLLGPEIQLTSQLAPQQELPWGVWAWSRHCFRFPICCYFPTGGVNSVLLTTLSHPHKTNGSRFSVSQTTVFLTMNCFLLTFESPRTHLTKAMNLPSADLPWLAKGATITFSCSPFACQHTQSLVRCTFSESTLG